ncbi:MBL fold metallo-hydrolase [Massilia sp. 9096]|uniref:MBL fold metallo-hydrolase n=1 Tax=Massilia sp. 9096 TaxID=1500894 RepID=UPI00056B0FAE|nr:MBL fold metallo-hydrolase [Massilia sp. 9096]
MNNLHIEGLFDSTTSTVSYIVMDTHSKACAIIDSVLDFDPKSGRTTTASADRIVERVQALDGWVEWILETHAHADHFSAAPYLKQRLGGRIAIGEHIRSVQNVFGILFHAEPEFVPDGRQFDHLFRDGECFTVGGLQAQVLHTPGHTPACVTYVFQEGDDVAAFVGDTMFMPDHGTARCDFPGGDARILFTSIRQLLELPDATRLYMCHDYQPGGRELQYVTTVAEARACNIHVRDGTSVDQFVDMRTKRDASLPMPVLMLPAVQVNMRAGALPPVEENGIRYLKIPINAI